MNFSRSRAVIHYTVSILLEVTHCRHLPATHYWRYRSYAHFVDELWIGHVTVIFLVKFLQVTIKEVFVLLWVTGRGSVFVYNIQWSDVRINDHGLVKYAATELVLQLIWYSYQAWYDYCTRIMQLQQNLLWILTIPLNWLARQINQIKSSEISVF